MPVLRTLATLCAVSVSLAAPAPHPMITPPPTLLLRDPRVQERDAIGSYINSVISGLGSDVSSYVISGVPQFFQDFPTGTAVESSLGITDSDLAATPTQVLNLPPYGNWTEQGWNVRVHGNVFKQPNISESKLDDLANIFLVGTSIQSLPADQQAEARNVTAEIFVVQQGGVNVTVTFVDDVTIQPDHNGGAFKGTGGLQQITLPFETTPEGDFDTFVVLANTTGTNGMYLLRGNETTKIQALNVYTNGTDTGNATAYLVPPVGLTIVSDIDDVLRVTKIYQPEQGLLNSFARPYTPWMNMPEIYANWSSSIPDFHFHYLTTTPEQITRNYMNFIYNYYPLGSFDTRPLNFSDVNATLSIRKFLLDQILETFPKRKFILIGDTSNSDIMRDYPQMAKDYPGQVQCIWLRNTTNTDPSDEFPYDTSGFQGLNQSQYMFFVIPDDLTNLDVINGQCYNESIKQNVTFSEQGLPFGIESAATAVGAPGLSGWLGTCVGLTVMMALVSI